MHCAILPAYYAECGTPQGEGDQGDQGDQEAIPHALTPMPRTSPAALIHSIII